MHRHRFTLLHILAALLALLAIAPSAIAEDIPQPPGNNAPGAHQPAPAPAPVPPASESGQPAPHARKEEEEAGFWSRIKAYGTAKTKLAANNSDLTNQLATLKDENDRLTAENARLTADITRLANWLTEQGIDPTAAAADPAKSFAEAVGAGVAATVRKIGVPAEKIQTRPDADPAATGTATGTATARPLQPHQHIAAHFASRGWKQPGLN